MSNKKRKEEGGLNSFKHIFGEPEPTCPWKQIFLATKERCSVQTTNYNVLVHWFNHKKQIFLEDNW